MIVAGTLYIATMEAAKTKTALPADETVDTIEELLDLDAEVTAVVPQREVSAAVVEETAGGKGDDANPPPREAQNVLDFIKT